MDSVATFMTKGCFYVEFVYMWPPWKYIEVYIFLLYFSYIQLYKNNIFSALLTEFEIVIWGRLLDAGVWIWTLCDYMLVSQ